MKKYTYTITFEAEEKNMQDYTYAIDLMSQAWVRHGKLASYQYDINIINEDNNEGIK